MYAYVFACIIYKTMIGCKKGTFCNYKSITTMLIRSTQNYKLLNYTTQCHSLKLQLDIRQFLTIVGNCLTKHQFVRTKCPGQLKIMIIKIISVNVRPNSIMSEHFWTCSDTLSGHFINI